MFPLKSNKIEEIGLSHKKNKFFIIYLSLEKSKNIKKTIIKGLKVYENLKELECMTKYLEKLLTIWNYNEEIFKCNSEVYLYIYIFPLVVL